MQHAIDEDKFIEFAADSIKKNFGSKEQVPNYIEHCFKNILNINIFDFM